MRVMGLLAPLALVCARLYALDAALDLASGATCQEMSGAVAGHVVEQGELMGTYQRP